MLSLIIEESDRVLVLECMVIMNFKGIYASIVFVYICAFVWRICIGDFGFFFFFCGLVYVFGLKVAFVVCSEMKGGVLGEKVR